MTIQEPRYIVEEIFFYGWFQNKILFDKLSSIFLIRNLRAELKRFIFIIHNYLIEFVEYFSDIFTEKFPFYRLRFKIKPGITGWAQVNMGYVNTEQDQYDKLEYEFYYLYHQSMFLDLFILLKTVQAILKMRGG